MHVTKRFLYEVSSIRNDGISAKHIEARFRQGNLK